MVNEESCAFMRYLVLRFAGKHKMKMENRNSTIEVPWIWAVWFYWNWIQQPYLPTSINRQFSEFREALYLLLLCFNFFCAESCMRLKAINAKCDDLFFFRETPFSHNYKLYGLKASWIDKWLISRSNTYALTLTHCKLFGTFY